MEYGVRRTMKASTAAAASRGAPRRLFVRACASGGPAGAPPARVRAFANVSKVSAARDAVLGGLDRGDDAETGAATRELADAAAASDFAASEPARSAALAGDWQLRWSEQAPGAGFLQRTLLGLARDGTRQIIGADGSLQNVVEYGPLTVTGSATWEVASGERVNVRSTRLEAEVGPVRIDRDIPPRDGPPGWVDVLYLDDELRISRGSAGSLFLHTRNTYGAGGEGGGSTPEPPSPGPAPVALVRSESGDGA